MILTSAVRLDTDSIKPVFVMFHGYGNNEQEMIRVIHAIDPDASYLSFRSGLERPFLGGGSWFRDPDDHTSWADEADLIGDRVTLLLRSPLLERRQKILIGFSQGAYLSWRVSITHPGFYETAILLAPPFPPVESRYDPACSPVRYYLAYGDLDRVISSGEQEEARRWVRGSRDHVIDRVPELAHGISDVELEHVAAFLKA